MSEEIQIAALSQALASLLPAGCAFEAAQVMVDLSGLYETELARIDTWAPHRQNEFAAGRYCARRVLSELGCLDSAQLEADADGVPVWPDGFLGSISHSRGVAAAVAVRTSECSLIGLDLEKTNRLTNAAMKRVIHPEEVEFVQDDQVKASILFSLKEAFYKAQFPRHRRRGNFQDLGLSVDAAVGRAEVAAMDTRFADELSRAMFAYCMAGDYVLSLCWLAAE
jgi:enterobactin synthetase component D